MGACISKILDSCTRWILQFTIYEMLCASRDFVDVKDALNDRTNWSIELFRSCFTIRLTNGGYFFTLSSLLFLFMAENMYMHYGRLTPAELKERVTDIGYATFAILFGLLDMGIHIVRVAGVFTLSGSPGLATGLVMISMMPSIIIPPITYLVKQVKSRRRQPSVEVEMESGSTQRNVEG